MLDDATELLVYDRPEQCPYLPGREARMPLRQPLEMLTGEQFDRRLAQGDRRCGSFLYRTACPSCQACVPIRIPIAEFQPSRTQARTYRRGLKSIELYVGQPAVDERRVELYNKHRHERGLDDRQGPITADDYREFLVNTCCDTLEIDYVVDDVLAAVAILDRGAKSLSAVYCYFDPDYSRLSLGVFSIMAQVQLARMWQMDYLYLGLFIEQSPHMNYKSAYRPHELLVEGAWRRSDSATAIRGSG